MLIAEWFGETIPSWPETEIAGSLDEWREHAAMLFAPGCEAQSFALLASFAAPLMALWRKPGGGAVVSLVGGRNSGKTTALEAAASVWGNPASSTLKTYVGNHKYAEIAEFGNMPVIADRLPRQSPEAIATLLRKFVAGTEWATIMLTAGAGPLFTDQGHAVLPGIELPIKVPSGLIERGDKRTLASNLISNRGHAGFQFLRTLLLEKELDWARRQLVSTYAGLCDRYGKDDETVLVRRAIAAAHTAGLIVADMGMIEFDPGRISSWAAEKALART